MTANQTGISTQAVLSMRSGGYYSERTYGAKQAIDKMLPVVQDALTPDPAASGILRVADFGAADGGTSRELWFKAFQALREGGDGREIAITYTDLPSNDFSTLFRTMQGLQGDEALAYQKQLDGVFVYGCGTGFHTQLFPSESLDFGFSATAMHYLSVKPCEISTHVHATGAEGAEADAFAEQARADWERILLARAAELKPGGRMVCLNFGIDEKGRYLGNTGGQHMFNMFDRFWKELRDEGKITPTEYERATFVQYYRTLEEFTAPLKDPSSPVAKAGLRLVDAFSTYTRCPYETRFSESGGSMTNAEFAKSLIPTMRSWSETVFLTALDGRPPAEAQALVDEFYQSYEDHVAVEPAGHAMDYIHIVVVMEKT
ncbi:SAM-dependent methyltransferase [Amorphus orientalis]|uniref:SAM-dependent methyltransferase n=1 Tax=Amorphus orientalis TaxID=649198 RepID=A0AAE4ASY2_9HYPH|nr:SAM-dependent methyltransferase [Amorphus orientalis]MDQ0315597.1 SAM-dependent methyltransferase [Amorphus orientalis]